MSVQLNGDSTGDFIGSNGGPRIHFSATAIQFQDGSGNELGQIDASTRTLRTVKVPLAAGVDTAGGIFAWQNPEAVSIFIDRVQIDLTTVASAACTLDIGSTATNATTLSDNLIDGIDVHTATGEFDNMLAANAGTNGLPTQKLASGKWVTGSTASGASAGLVGNAYITYHLV